jgi:hypothetical protein
MSLQPGDGYTFKASSNGFSLDIEKPWIPPAGDGGFVLGFAVPKLPDPPQPPDPPVPPEVPSFVDPFAAKLKPLQFQCGMIALPVSGTPAPVLQVALGSVTYTHSLMPLIKNSPFTDYRQAYMNFAAVLSSGITPVPVGDSSSPWMLGGGGYALTGTGRWFVTLSKWDAGNGEFSAGLLDQNLPWVSIVKDGSDQFNKLFVDSGPSLYQNKTNVQKMSGYDAASTGLTTDWGNCHTTWFNPRFFGHHVRVLAVIDSIAATPCTVSVVQIRAGSATANEIQQVIFVGIYKSGTVTFTYGAATTTSGFNPGSESAYDLQQCLNTIPALKGNVIVQLAGPGVYQVEFTNSLKNTDVATLTPNSSLTSFTTWYSVYQCSVGSQDIVIPCELNATQLMNVSGKTEAEDPYNLNAATTPVKWAHVVNYEDAYAANALTFTPAFATPVINDTTPRTFTKRILNYGEASGCTAEPTTDHPFKVIHVSTTGGMSTYRIVSGTVNNVTPGNIASNITVSTSTYEVWVKAPFASGLFPNPTGFEWNIGTPLPSDTDAEGYIRIATVNGATVTQYVTGSLWADRIKLGSATATYFYARI